VSLWRNVNLCLRLKKVTINFQTSWVIILYFWASKVPKRVGKAKKDGHAHAQDEDDNLLLLDRKGTVERVPSRSESKLNITHMPTPSPRNNKQKAPARSKDDSDTEEGENDEELLLNLKKPTNTGTPVPPGQEKPLPTPARSLSPLIVDPGRAPGRIIGNTYPLKDFKKNIAQGDVVTKAVQDLAEVIVEVVLKPFATRRRGEMIECMKILRKTCLEVCLRFIVQLLVANIVEFRRMRSMHGMCSSVI